ncbi:hypothetical protein MPF19_01825 [Polaribacter sp. Z014]|uniref:hypothetical protein n=1 Tax=unclassified Polaribacter TaxID=196858 RepID=UPI00193C468B|nr:MULTISPECIES: hypothetical protein [unclassified Polaribacter]MCL7762136.1 hypothetical protein [Polaribacter sp. Z014]QVY64435.1 hypothetical protein JOP69_11720 [Polaribacter sp. Q13]
MKIKIAFFFSILFIGVLTAPTIISLVDENQDISIFLSLNEEEEDSEEIKTFKELKVVPNIYLSVFFKKIQKREIVRFTSKNYTSLFPRKTTPPPQFVF